MQTTKLFELLAVAVAFASADYGASAQTSDSIDTSKQMPADTLSVSSTTDAIQPDKMRSLRTVDAPAARIGEERASIPASLTEAAGIANEKAAAETVYEATASKSLSEYLLSKVGGKTDLVLKRFVNVKKAPKKGKDGTPAYQLYWPRKLEIMVVILPHLESGKPLSTILENFPLVSEQHFIQGVAEFMEETNVPEMKRNVQHLLNQDRNEIDILFSFESSLNKVEDIKYSVILYYTRLLSHEKVRKMVYDLLDRGHTKEAMLLEMQKAEGGAFLPGAIQRLENFYDVWSFAKTKPK